MARKNTKVIAHTTPISADEAEEIFKEFSKIPMADALIETFKFAVDSRTFRKKENSKGCEVFASVEDQNVRASMILRQVHQKVELLFYTGAMEEIAAVECIADFYNESAVVSAGPLKFPILGNRKGILDTYGISVYLYEDIYLPTNYGRWFLSLMNRLALITTEFHLDISDPRRYSDDEKEDEEKEEEPE